MRHHKKRHKLRRRHSKKHFSMSSAVHPKNHLQGGDLHMRGGIRL
jgi:hypothetical protein